MARKKADSAAMQETRAKNPQSEAPAEGPAETQNTGENDGENTGGDTSADDGSTGDGGSTGSDGEGEAGGADSGEGDGGAVAPGAGEGPHQPGMRIAANAQIAGLPPAVAAAAMNEAHKNYVDLQGNAIDLGSAFTKEGPKGRSFRVTKRVFEETTVPGNPGATRRRLVFGEGRIVPGHEYLEAMDAAESVSGTGEAGQ